MTSIFLLALFFGFQQDSIEYYIQKGLEAAYIEEYDSAKVFIKKAVESDTNNPLGYFVYTGLLRLYSSDFVTDSLCDSFFYYCDKTNEKANLSIRKKKKDAWSHYYIGGINMYISSLYIEKGNYIKAFGFAEKSINEIRLCLSEKPDLYDAFLIMGSYEYLKGSFPFWGSYKNKGIEKIRMASQMSKYSGPTAKNILAVLLQNEKRYDESIKEARELVETFPKSRTFLWTLCKTYMAQGDWENAAKNFELLLLNILEGQPNNNYNIIQVELSLATTYYHNGNYEKTIEFCEDIFRLSENDKRTKDMVKKARKIYNDAKKNQ